MTQELLICERCNGRCLELYGGVCEGCCHDLHMEWVEEQEYDTATDNTD